MNSLDQAGNVLSIEALPKCGLFEVSMEEK
jgi:hypothetical protein